MVILRKDGKRQKKALWITNGVHNDDGYRVVIRAEKEIRCSHCMKVKEGFEFLGKRPDQYGICNNCLYNPSLEMINKLFITISERNEPEEFKQFLKSCINKDYFEKYFPKVNDG